MVTVLFSHFRLTEINKFADEFFIESNLIIKLRSVDLLQCAYFE